MLIHRLGWLELLTAVWQAFAALFQSEDPSQALVDLLEFLVELGLAKNERGARVFFPLEDGIVLDPIQKAQLVVEFRRLLAFKAFFWALTRVDHRAGHVGDLPSIGH